MGREPDYYAILGVEPTADAGAIDAAYRGRSLPFRVGQLRRRTDETTGPTQEGLEQAYAILSNPQSRLLYDKIYFPDKPQPAPRRRIPAWVWGLTAAWIAAIVVVGCIGIRSRITPDESAIGQIVRTATAGMAIGNAGAVATAPPSSPTPLIATAPAVTVAAALPPTATATTVMSTATPPASTAPTAMATPTNRPTDVPIAAPAATSTITVGTPTPTQAATAPTATVQPTATIAPTSTVVPQPTATVVPIPTATAPPPLPTPEPPPPPAPTEAPPPFQPTDRIGTALSVNLRNGPGAGYGSLGLLPTGTQLRATGESAYSGGQLWRRFVLRDGRQGWVRDLDVFPVR
ncbi:MAG: hypothetical protein AVDCRST_MAG18-641 [uncultured Thermomicrobiales bacterium]|uniref:J domain-containing protein n=1 Tax=uncultured Thermomicrobiales bacterium TaxID=1645740 RepID=A0A6J4UT20_9BACT|nr:MAG: hypothetical protein AVDCRST_MAG18-641 [uncultured Thermomicrobiales bacterium]